MQKQIIFDFYNTLYNPESRSLFRGSVTMLKKLKKSYRLSIITTYDKEREKQIRNLGLFKYFNSIVICKKKTIRIFQQLIEGYKINLIIGDRPEEEIQIGKNLGLKTLKVDRRKENPIRTITRELRKGLL